MLALALFFSACMTTQAQVCPSKAVFLELVKPSKMSLSGDDVALVLEIQIAKQIGQMF